MPLEQPQQAGRGVAVKAAEVPGNVAAVVTGTPIVVVAEVAAVTLVAVPRDVADVAAPGQVAAITLVAAPEDVAAVTLVAVIMVVVVGGRAVVRVVAGVHRPPPRLPAPGRSVCMVSFNTQSPGRVVHRQDAAAAIRTEIA
ncbi:hypothetical protein [Microbispora rosea]|uniref:hypothetical protein n=1 Tax=Microbispora rosea TaxID=58117 RepID=UPI0004C3799B|nr:hypothetical protein [Microbispora rosea]